MLELAAALICAVCAALVYARFIEPARITFKRVQIRCPGLEKSVKIAAIADIHAHFGGMNGHRVAKILAAVREEKPDIAVFLGDLFEDYRKYSHGREHELADALELPGLENCLKIAVMGNHDVCGSAESAYREIFALAGWTVLVNERTEHMGLNIIGSDGMKYGNPDIRTLIEKNKLNVVLIHEPDYAEWLRGITLQLSGHTHGGQVRAPFFGPLKLPVWGRKYIHGLYQKADGGHVFVTRGLGMSTLPLRFLAPPEIGVVTLVPYE